MNKKLTKDLEDAAWFISAANWRALGSEGLCIPISYALHLFMELRHRSSMVAETTLLGVDPRSALRLEMRPIEDNPFLGHVVTILPTQKRLLDGSLWSQQSKVLANANLPTILVAPWTKGLPVRAQVGRVNLTYRIDLKAQTWRTRDWPWKEIRNLVTRAEKELR